MILSANGGVSGGRLASPTTVVTPPSAQKLMSCAGTSRRDVRLMSCRIRAVRSRTSGRLSMFVQNA